jgi:hypothetical protein
MKIPSVFYGTFKKVKAEVNKLLTKINRGIPPEEIFSPFELLDINDYPTKFFPRANGEYEIPNNLIWLNRMWSMAGTEEHFILSQLWQGYYWKNLNKRVKLSIEDRERYDAEEEKLRYRLISYLADTEWGACSLHTEEAKYLLGTLRCDSPKHEIKIDPDFALMILKSTVKYWDNFMSYGDKFYIGGSGCRPFPEASSGIAYIIIGDSGYDPDEFPCGVVKEIRFFQNLMYGDIKKICEKYPIIERLEKDEDLREKFYAGYHT